MQPMQPQQPRSHTVGGDEKLPVDSFRRVSSKYVLPTSCILGTEFLAEMQATSTLPTTPDTKLPSADGPGVMRFF